MKDVIVIGDVHGCYDTFRKLLKKLPKRPQKILVGDIIDRGPRSREMIEFLINNPEIHCVLGNHEAMMLQTLDNFPGALQQWMYNGGKDALNSYGFEKGKIIDIPVEHEEYLRSLPLYWANDELIVSHSGNIRDPWDRYLLNPPDSEKFHIHGHTPIENPEIGEKSANIDTGCVFGRKQYLTAIRYPNIRIYQQKNIDEV